MHYLLGDYSSCNMGDLAIYLGMRASGEFPRASAIDLGGTLPGKTVPRLEEAEILPGDRLVIGGGGLFAAGGDILPKAAAINAIRPLGSYELRGCGIEPLHTDWEVALLGLIVNLAERVTVRDQASLETLRSWGIRRDIEAVPDYSHFMKPCSPGQAHTVLQAAGVPAKARIIGINLLGLTAARLRRWTVICRWILRAWSHHLVFIPTCYKPEDDDREFGRALAARLSSERFHVLERPQRPDVLKGIAGQVDLMVAHRYHAGQFAHQMGRPVAMVATLQKQRALALESGHSWVDHQASAREIWACIEEGMRRVESSGVPGVRII